MDTLRYAALVLALLAATKAAGKEEVYRLPDEIRPVTQAIELRVDPSEERFSGRVDIVLEIDAPVERIGIHQLGLELRSIRLAAAGVTRELQANAGSYDIHWLHDGERIAAGIYELTIDYSGRFATDALGMHSVEFEGNDYVFTQFEAMHARRAMPIFDEPVFKIPYRLTIVAPEELTVVSNTPVAERSVADGWQRVEFMQTKPLPSYLIAYAVGPLDRVPIGNISVPGFIYTPKGRAGEVGFVQRETPKILAWLEDYFGGNYPYRKLDFIAVPDFAFGAMENAGLVTFRSDALLVGDDVRGIRALRVLNIIAHELAHMWFGDVVTMKWWNDLWLNEAFAAWMAKRAVNSVYPSLKVDLQKRYGSAFSTDMRITSAPIRIEVRTEREALVNVGLNYSKGSELLLMLEAYVGFEKWRDGIRHYIDKYRWGNAEERELWGAVAEVSGLDVTALASPYLNQPGFPLVSVDADGNVAQQRFVPLGLEAPELMWQVPMGIKYKHDGEIRQAFYLLEKRTGRLDVPAGVEWILPQANAVGYYRWKIEPAHMDGLLADFDKLDDREKLVLVDNADALVAAGEASMAEYLQVVDRLLDDADPAILKNGVDALRAAGATYAGPANAELFGRYLDRRLAARMREIGFETRPEDSELVMQLRPSLLRLLGEYGTDRQILGSARDLARRFLRSPDTVDPDLGREALRVTALNDDGSLYEDYIDAYRESSSPVLKSAILSSIYFRDPDVVRRHLDFSISAEVPSGDSTDAIALYPTVLDDHSVLYDWLEENFAAFEAKMPSVRQVSTPQRLTGICNDGNLSLLRDFFSGRDEKYATSLAKALESVATCIASKNRESAAVNDFLRRNAG